MTKKITIGVLTFMIAFTLTFALSAPAQAIGPEEPLGPHSCQNHNPQCRRVFRRICRLLGENARYVPFCHVRNADF